jgi:parallel beta-helix repeat protein
VGAFLFPGEALVISHTFAGTTYYAAVRSGVRGWVLLDHGISFSTVLNSALALSGKVFLGAGTFPATSTITMSYNRELIGAGRGVTIINFNAAGSDCIEVNVGGAAQEFGAIRDLELNWTAGNIGIEVYRVSYFEITNVEVSGFGSYGISITESHSVTVENCKVLSNANSGIRLVSCDFAEVNHCHFGDNANSNLEFDGCNDCTVEASRFINTVTASIHIYVHSTTAASYRCKVIGNHIGAVLDSVNLDAIYFDATTYALERAIIVGNTVTGDSTRNSINTEALYSVVASNNVGTGATRGIGLLGSDYSVAVGNTITYNLDGSGMGWGATYCVVANNTLHGMSYGLYCSKDYNIIIGNCLYNVNPCGILLAWGADYCYVIGNFVVGPTSQGIYVSDDSNNNLIHGNWTIGCTTSCIINTADCDNTRIWGNNFDEAVITNNGTGTVAFDNYDPSANVWLTSISAPTGGR